MRIDAVWKRWIEILAGLIVAVQEAWRARNALCIGLENNRPVVRSGAAALARVPTAAALPDAARGHFVTLELPPDEIVLQRINVPAQAREFLPGIIRNQIERLSPWPIDQVVYGFDAVASPTDPQTLDARVLMTARGQIETARSALAGMGVTPDRIVAREQGSADAPPITLWSRFDTGSGRGLERPRRMIVGAVLAVFGISVAVSAWSLFSASAIWAESEDVATRTAALQRQLQPSRPSLASASADPAERAWISKQTAPAGMMVLEALSRALPDDAYITELSLQKSMLRIVGLTSDAPSLIAPLEHFGQFAEVRFFAPSTRGPDGRLYWFHIEARVEPHNELAENGQ
jgi:general secretion pathway protein L